MPSASVSAEFPPVPSVSFATSVAFAYSERLTKFHLPPNPILALALLSVLKLLVTGDVPASWSANSALTAANVTPPLVGIAFSYSVISACV